jgi:RNA polymerase sigma-70 factor (ECF subfamily)
LPSGGERSPAPPRSPAGPQLRALLDRYIRAWEAADIADLVGLLREDALLAMPPMPSVVGDRAIGAFLADVIFAGRAQRRLIETAANGAPAFIAYSRSAAGEPLEAAALVVLSVVGQKIVRLDAYADHGIVARFGLPETLGD